VALNLKAETPKRPIAWGFCFGNFGRGCDSASHSVAIRIAAAGARCRRYLVGLRRFAFRLGLICAAYAFCMGQSYSGFGMSVKTIENLLKVMREQVSQKDINHTVILAMDEIIREVRRLDIEIRNAKRTVNRRF
jgi:hypothetical protein